MPADIPVSELGELFRRDGFVLLSDFFPVATMSAAREASDHVIYGCSFDAWAKTTDGRDLPLQKGRVKFPTGKPVIDSLIEDDRLLDLFGACLNTDAPKFCNGHLFTRNGVVNTPASLAAQGRWHIDHDTDSYLPPRDDFQSYAYVNCHIFLDEITSRHAPMSLIPGSHRLVAQEFESFWNLGIIEARGNFQSLPKGADFAHAISCVGPVGSVLLYSSYLLHRAVSFEDCRVQRPLFACTMVRPDNNSWKRISWPYTFQDRPLANDFFVRTTTRMRTALGWPPPEDPYYSPATLRLIAHWYPGIDLSDYWRAQ